MSVKRNLLSLALAAAVLSLSGGAQAADPAKKEIVFGATAGPYSCLLYTSSLFMYTVV